MDLKLTNNNLLSLGSTIGSGITTNCTTVFVKNCPNVSGITILRQCPNLTRVRLDIGNVLGSLDELLQYSTLNGFNDSYEPQTKPRLVGNFTLSQPEPKENLIALGFDPFIVTENSNLSQESTVFDGLTITIPDTSYIIYYRIQTYNSEYENYNPWLALKFNQAVTGGLPKWSDNSIRLTDINIRLGGGGVYSNSGHNIGIYYYAAGTITDSGNNIVDNPGQTWSFNNIIDYEKMNIYNPDNTGCAAIYPVAFKDTVKYYFPSTWFAIHVSQLYGPTYAQGELIGSEYHFRGTLQQYIWANLGTRCISSYGGGVYNTMKSPVNIYIDVEGKELSEYDAATINSCFSGLQVIPRYFMFSKAHITEIPNNTTEISSLAFATCPNINFQLPTTLRIIGACAFSYSNLSGNINLPNLTTLEGTALYVGGTVGAFAGTKISSIENLGSITDIWVKCFQGCQSLQTAILPSTTERICREAFSYCTSLSLVIIKATTVPTLDNTNAFYNCSSLNHIYVGTGSRKQDEILLESYKSTSGWSSYSSKLYTYYSYAAPQISYDGTEATMSVTRTADIYYTLDGTTPTTSSTKYTGSFVWNGTGVIKAMSIDTNNDIVYSDDFYAQTTTTPVPEFMSNGNIQITSETGATIYYTLDGSNPYSNGIQYTGPISYSNIQARVRCYAEVSGKNQSLLVDSNIIAWNSFAVQTLDDTKPNYNPALSIILSEHNVGHILSTPVKSNGGRYMLLKSEAAVIPNIGTSWNNGWFIDKGTVVDSNNIIDGGSYDFEEFTEFQYFTSVTMIPDAGNPAQMQYCAFSCNKLKTIILPSSITYIGSGAFKCPLEGDIIIPQGVTILTQNCFSIGTARIIVHDNITKFDYDCFGQNATAPDRIPKNLTTLNGTNYSRVFANDYTLPATCININGGREVKGSPLLNNCVHWLAPSLTADSYNSINNYWYFAAISKVYVGTGEDKDADDAILSEYQSHLTNVANKFDTWYNYLHPTT